MSMSPREARLAYALLKIRKSQIDRALNEVSPYLDQDPGDKNAAKLGAAKLGTVAMTDPEVKAYVKDRDAFTAWVRENAKTEIQDAVRPAFERKVIDDATRMGAAVDANGEEIPGISFGTATPQQRFYAAEGAEEFLTVVSPHDLPEVDGIDLPGLLGIKAEESE